MGNEIPRSQVSKPELINPTAPSHRTQLCHQSYSAATYSKARFPKTNASYMHLSTDSVTPSDNNTARLATRMSPQSLLELPEVEDIGADSPSTAHAHSADAMGTHAASNAIQRNKTGRPIMNKHYCTDSASLRSVVNGITGVHISSRICKIASVFWKCNIDNLPVEQQLEIGCAIFFGAMAADANMKRIMKENLIKNNKNIEANSLKFLDMLGYLLRHLIQDNIDLYEILVNLGKFHLRMGIHIEHFTPMLSSLHESLSYYFPSKYTIEVKYAMDEIFTLAAQLMTGQDLQNASKLNDINNSFANSEEITFLKNLQECLSSPIGREYFYKYLNQTFCEEMVLFLQTLSKFKTQSTPIQRFMIARDINKVSIQPQADFALNISHECRQNAMKAMRKLEMKYAAKQPLNIEFDFFHQVEHETYRLIHDNHWYLFVEEIKSLHSKSKGLK